MDVSICDCSPQPIRAVAPWRLGLMNDGLPVLTGEFPPIGGVAKLRDEDFFVEEVPLYEASGQGTHTYALIEKRGVTTRQAVSRVARAIGVLRKDVGYAGLKDTHAVARQWISVEHVSAERLEGLDVPNVRILRTACHTNKIKLGHLAGNRFIIRLRRVTEPLDKAAEIAQQVLAVLSRRGVPNYFGPQRFGQPREGGLTNYLLGAAIVRGDTERFVDVLLGPDELQHNCGSGAAVARQVEARAFYQQGDYQQALAAWPGGFDEYRRALRALIRSGGNKKKAFDAVDNRLKSLFVSAYQSQVFNQVVAARMPNIDRLMAGDMAYKHDNGACFVVGDPELEQPRCERFEVSPTGPLIGLRLTRLAGPAGAIENPILAQTGLGEAELRRMRRCGIRGGRRPLRFRPHEPQVDYGQDELGPYLELRFRLDAGCYATVLLSEITKSSLLAAEQE